MITLVIVVAICMMASTGLIIRFAHLPPWSHRDLLAYTAMMATILGLLILVVFVDRGQKTFVDDLNRLINELVRDPNVKVAVGDVVKSIVDALADNMKFAMIGVIAGILSLGLVISARTLKASGLGANLELATGDDGKLALPVVVTQPKETPAPVSEKPAPGATDLPPPKQDEDVAPK